MKDVAKKILRKYANPNKYNGYSPKAYVEEDSYLYVCGECWLGETSEVVFVARLDLTSESADWIQHIDFNAFTFEDVISAYFNKIKLYAGMVEVRGKMETRSSFSSKTKDYDIYAELDLRGNIKSKSKEVIEY